jgi:hypothetical protein
MTSASPKALALLPTWPACRPDLTGFVSTGCPADVLRAVECCLCGLVGMHFPPCYKSTEIVAQVHGRILDVVGKLRRATSPGLAPQ